VLQSKLCDDSNCSENIAMVVQVVSVLLFQAFKLLEPAIHSFMAFARIGSLLMGIPLSFQRQWCSDEHAFTIVSIISLHLFTRCKPCKQFAPKNSQIRESTTRKGTINPNNMASSDAHTDLIPDARTVELVAVPAFPER